MPPRPDSPRSREAEPPNYGSAYNDLQHILEKELQKALAAGRPFDAELTMPRATFDALKDEVYLTTEGWKILNKTYYEHAVSADDTAPVAPEPIPEPLKNKDSATETNKENVPKPHEYVVQKTKDGFRIMKRGGEKSINRTFATNVSLSDAIKAHLERDPAFGVEVANEANRLRKEWRYRRDLVVDLPVLEGVEWGTPEEVDAQFEEFMKEPDSLAIVARYKEHGRRKSKTLVATEVFPKTTFTDILGKIPKRSPEDPAAQQEWDKWGNITFRDGVVDHIVGKVLAQRYAVKYGEPNTEQKPTDFETSTASKEPPAPAPAVDITPESHRLTAFAGPSGPQKDVGDLASRWAKENPDDTDTTRAKTLPKKGTDPKVDKSKAPTPKQTPSPAPAPKKAPKGTLEIVEFHDNDEPMEVRDDEVVEVKENSKEAEITAARTAITATIEKVSRAVPELGEQLATPGMRERMTDWYTELFTGRHVAQQERAAFGLVYDKQTSKVVVKMKTFRNAVQAFKNLHEKKGV